LGGIKISERYNEYQQILSTVEYLINNPDAWEENAEIKGKGKVDLDSLKNALENIGAEGISQGQLDQIFLVLLSFVPGKVKSY